MTRAASAASGDIFSAPQMALDLPFGIGPLQFHNYFPEDTHNSYPERLHVRWLDLRRLLSGAGVRHGHPWVSARLRAVPWQRAYLAIFAAFLGTVGESFIIDTDHWRHFWMMLGAMWGMFAAAHRYEATCEFSDRRSSDARPERLNGRPVFRPRR